MLAIAGQTAEPYGLTFFKGNLLDLVPGGYHELNIFFKNRFFSNIGFFSWATQCTSASFIITLFVFMIISRFGEG